MASLITYFYLFIAIIFEVIGTSALQASAQFTKIVPLIVMICSYLITFCFLALTLREMHVGVAYAIWSGVGIVLITLVGLYHFGQKLDPPAVLGMALIITGVVIMNVFSKSITH
jgi:small multidrug resistance pump